MKLKPAAQNIIEWLGLQLGLIPTPLAWSHFGFMASKFLMEAVDKGIFEAIGYGQPTVNEVANKCNLNFSATQSLLGVLATMNLLKEQKGKIILTSSAKKWLLKDSPVSLYWLIIFDNRVCEKWMNHTGTFLQTGKGLQYHDTFHKEEWFYYQKAMEAVAKTVAKEAANKIPLPSNARQMLDIGGAHALFSVSLCKKYPALSATILDLPGAVEEAKTILDTYNMGDRVKHLAGNVLTDDLGENKYDFVLMTSVAHHLTDEENRMVSKKVYKALKPGGVFTIMEVLKHNEIVQNGNMLSALGDLFFALSSTSGAWSLSQIQEWQTAGGLEFYKKNSFISIPGYVGISSRK